MTSRIDQPRILILETSGRVGQVAVAQGEDLGPVRALERARRHGRDLAPSIAELCRSRGWRVRDLEAIIVSRGPGSYTGLRVGFATAKALSYATGAALLCVDTFAAVAEQVPEGISEVEVLADAQQRNLYVQRFRRSGDSWQSSDLAILAAKDWIDKLDRQTRVTGPGLSIVEADLPASQPRVPLEAREPATSSLLRLGLKRWRAGEADDFWTAEPLYLRPSSAEELWEKKTVR